MGTSVKCVITCDNHAYQKSDFSTCSRSCFSSCKRAWSCSCERHNSGRDDTEPNLSIFFNTYIRRFRHIWGSFEVCLGSFSSSCAALLGMFRGLKFLHRMSSRSVQSLISSKFQPFCGAQPNPQRSFQYIPFLVVKCVIHCSPQVSDCIAIDSNLGPGSGPGLRDMYHGWPGKLPNAKAAKERSVLFCPCAIYFEHLRTILTSTKHHGVL